MKTITITLSEKEEAVMAKAVKRYRLTLEQACKYGFFNFESTLDPNSGDAWSAIDVLFEALNPDSTEALENRYVASPGQYEQEETESETPETKAESQSKKAA